MPSKPTHKRFIHFGIGMVLILVCNITTLFSQSTLQSADSIAHLFHEISPLDSLSSKILPSDSLPQLYIHKLDSATQALNKQIALLDPNLLGENYTRQLDSLYRSFQENALKKFTSPGDSLNVILKERTALLDSLVAGKRKYIEQISRSDELGSIEKTVGLSEKLEFQLPTNSELPGIDAGIKLPGGDVSVPAIPAAEYDIPTIDNPSLKTLGDGDLSKIQDAVQQAGEITNKSEEITSEAEKLKQGEYNKELESAAEERLKKESGVPEVNAPDELTEVKDKASSAVEEAADKEAVKEKALQRGRKEVSEHFTGKEEIIRKDMESLTEAQIKYRDVADSRFLPKRRPNPMKAKPFVERLIPGLSMQVLHNENVSVDFNPFIGYRFSGVISAGLGGFRRLTYFRKAESLEVGNVYGVRTFTTVKVIKGISAFLELEKFKSDETISSPMGPVQSSNAWKTRMNLGVHQRYSIGNKLYGHFIIMYDILKIKTFPNTSGSSVRFGFDYQLSKRKDK